MNAYVYCDKLYCERCSSIVKAQAASRAARISRHRTGDPRLWPQGPCRNGGGSADLPHHCGNCGKFLKNPLTPAGVRYVMRVVACDSPVACEVLKQWQDFYLGDYEPTRYYDADRMVVDVL